MAAWQGRFHGNVEDAMKRNSLFKARVALAALETGADLANTAARFGVAPAEVQAWAAQFQAWTRHWARRAWR